MPSITSPPSRIARPVLVSFSSLSPSTGIITPVCVRAVLAFAAAWVTLFRMATITPPVAAPVAASVAGLPPVVGVVVGVTVGVVPFPPPPSRLPSPPNSLMVRAAAASFVIFPIMVSTLLAAQAPATMASAVAAFFALSSVNHCITSATPLSTFPSACTRGSSLFFRSSLRSFIIWMPASMASRMA